MDMNNIFDSNSYLLIFLAIVLFQLPKILEMIFKKNVNNGVDMYNVTKMEVVIEKITNALDGIMKELNKISSVLDKTIERQNIIENKIENIKITIEDIKKDVREIQK